MQKQTFTSLQKMRYLMFLAPILAVAQSANAQTSDNATSITPSQIGDIVVTAQKRSENLQKVPISVSALDASTIARTGISNVNDVARKVPSLFASDNLPTQVSYKLRGLGNEADVTAFEPEVALFFDGAYRLNGVFGASDLIDVERIEVLKGPQASLYGKNATAGVVNIITSAPNHDFSGALDVDLNQYRVRNRGYITGGLSDTVAARLSYFVTKGISGVQDNVGTDRNGGFAGTQWGIRPQITFTPSDRLNIRLIGGYSYRRLRPSSPSIYFSPTDAAVINAVATDPAGLAAADPDQLADGVINSDAQPLKSEILAPGANRRDVTQTCFGCGYRAKVETYEATGIVNYDLDGATITSITSYDHYQGLAKTDGSYSPLSFSLYRKDDSSRNIAEELRISSNNKSSPLQWLIGGYYYSSKIAQTVHLDNGSAIDEYGIAAFGTTRVYGLPGDRVAVPGSIKTQLFAGFGNISYNLTDELMIKLGARYSTEKKHGISEINQFTLDPRNLGTSIVQFVAAQPFDLERRFNHLSGDVTVQYQIDSDVMAYGSFATAYKSGGFNLGLLVTPTSAPFKPEKVKSFEAGLKTTFLDRRLRLNFAGFYTIVDDYQAGAFEGFFYGVNNADATTRGFEAEMIAKLGGGFTFDANAAYVDAYYRSFPGGPCFPGNTNTTATGCDLSGKTLPYSAKFRGSVGLSYESESGAYGRVDQFYTTRYNASTNLDPRSVQKAYGLTNLRVGWRKDSFDLALYVNNIFDKVYVQYEAPAAAVLGAGLQSYLVGHRELGGTLRINF